MPSYAPYLLLFGTIVNLTFDIYAFLSLISGKLKPYQALGVGAIGGGIELAAIIAMHFPFRGWSFLAAVEAFAIAVWWIKGGGDDTKKKARKLARKFKPVRRTAPVAA